MTILIDETGQALPPGTVEHWHANTRRGVEVVVASHDGPPIAPVPASSSSIANDVTGPTEAAA